MTGCATKTEYIKVPPEPPPIVVRPELETDKLKTGDGADVVIQAHRITILRLIQYAKELEAILDGYRRPTDK